MSVLVITHRGTESAIPVAESVAAQAEADGLDVEFVIVGNGCPADVSVLPESPRIRYVPVVLETNMGVGQGRAAGAAAATSTVLAVLDDHVTLGSGTLASVKRAFAERPMLGAVAFRVIDPESLKPTLWYYPQLPAEDWSECEFEVSSVVGCGCAFRMDAYREAGGFWGELFFCMEEVELTWRVLDAGWQVVHLPGATVFHRDRTVEEYKRVARQNVFSAIASALRNLPLYIAIPQTTMKAAVFMVRGLEWGAFKDVIRGLKDVASRQGAIASARKPLRPETVRYLRSTEAPLSRARALQWLRPSPPSLPPAMGSQPVKTR